MFSQKDPGSIPGTSTPDSGVIESGAPECDRHDIKWSFSPA